MKRQMFMTAGMADLLKKGVISGEDLAESAERFFSNDWGTLCEEDTQAQKEMMDDGCMIMGIYESNNITFWIIQDPTDPRETDSEPHITMLLPEEY